MADIIDLSNMNRTQEDNAYSKHQIYGAPKISAIIVARAVTAVFLQSLLTIIKQPYLKEVIIIEQGNKNWILASLKKLAKEHAFIRIVHQPTSLSLATCYNLGANKAYGDRFLFLTGNMILPENFFQELVVVSYQKQEPYIIGASNQKFDLKTKNQFIQMIFPHTAWRGLRGKAPNDNIQSVKLSCGSQHVSAVLPSCLLVSSASYKLLNGFDSQISGEAAVADFCLRAHMQGGGVYEFNAKGLHQFSAQSYYGTPFKRAKGWLQYYKKFYWQSKFGVVLRPLAVSFWLKLKFAEIIGFCKEHLFKLRMNHMMRHQKISNS